MNFGFRSKETGNPMKMRTDIITMQPRRGAEAIFARVRAAGRRPRNRREQALALIRENANPRTIAIAGGALVAVAGAAYLGRRLFWQTVAVTAEAVEGIADTIEDAAEDLGEAARARVDGGSN
jgi:hypothetical protein